MYLVVKYRENGEYKSAVFTVSGERDATDVARAFSDRLGKTDKTYVMENALFKGERPDGVTSMKGWT